ncbi:hypothetical protein BAD_1265 [Bifidobacterium adolescentis ATCC 15703]|uniref:TetR family transcriptional regulator n=1 Tax=Bifidobacterium adolescentis (strain ATCC 15703 / DSM 20083 / NCTC 11814 / E194a) TaxID=367928 RepID=A1A2W3_BIFAA|nr:hypothetical protein BAD_1265 [Bifidobacterium adolescentis ATCC 15703]
MQAVDALWKQEPPLHDCDLIAVSQALFFQSCVLFVVNPCHDSVREVLASHVNLAFRLFVQ